MSEQELQHVSKRTKARAEHYESVGYRIIDNPTQQSVLSIAIITLLTLFVIYLLYLSGVFAPVAGAAGTPETPAPATPTDPVTEVPADAYEVLIYYDTDNYLYGNMATTLGGFYRTPLLYIDVAAQPPPAGYTTDQMVSGTAVPLILTNSRPDMTRLVAEPYRRSKVYFIQHDGTKKLMAESFTNMITTNQMIETWPDYFDDPVVGTGAYLGSFFSSSTGMVVYGQNCENWTIQPAPATATTTSNISLASTAFAPYQSYLAAEACDVPFAVLTIAVARVT